MRYLREIIKTPSFRTLGIFAGGNFFVAVLGGLGGLIQARWIDPDVFGEFRKFGILTSYLNIGLVLVHDGLMRQYPYLLGQGNKADAFKVAGTAKWWYLFVSWCFSILFVGLSLTSVLQGDYRAAVGWSVQILVVWGALYGAYLGVMYRTSSDFKRLTYNSTIASIFGFGALVIVKVWGYWGLAVRALLSNTVALYLSRRYVPVKVKAKFDVRGLIDLAKISLPLSIPGYIGTSFLTASMSFIVLKYCGQHGLGIYGTAFTFQAMAMTLTTAIHQMFITKLTYKFGETEDVAACLKWAKRPTLLSLAAATVLAVALCLVIGPFIRLVLPKYVDAIPVIQILSISLPLAALQLPLIILKTALWYKSVISLTAIRVLVSLAAVTILPKTLIVIVACLLLGDVCSLTVGFGILNNKRARRTA
ncbi:MAG: oligosaccharide flippase family protein [bacterium]